MVVWVDALGNSAFAGQGWGRVGLGLSSQNNEFWALYCQTITQLWTGQRQAFICSVTKLWAKLWTVREQPRPQVLPWLALALAGCAAGCQVPSQVQGNVQVHKMFDTRDVFRKMWTPRWRFDAGLNCVVQHVSCVTSTVFKLVASKRIQMLIIKQIRLLEWVFFFMPHVMFPMAFYVSDFLGRTVVGCRNIQSINAISVCLPFPIQR